VYKYYPIIVAEQIIDNNQEQKLKRIITINDQPTEKTLVVPPTTKRYQSSKGKLNSSKAADRRSK
jgi:hypothetical protein